MEGSWAPEAPSGAASWAFFPPRTAKNYADDIKLDTNVVKGYQVLASGTCVLRTVPIASIPVVVVGIENRTGNDVYIIFSCQNTLV